MPAAMWHKGEPLNDVVVGYLWLARILLFVMLPIIVLGLIGAIAAHSWIAIPVLAAFTALLYALRRWSLWVSANSAR